MIKAKESLLLTGCKTVNEFVEAFYKEVRNNPLYGTSYIRSEYCDQCKSMACDNCFIHDCLKKIYRETPFM